MLLVNLACIVIGLVMWFVPRMKFPPAKYAKLARTIRNNTLLGQRKQLVASLYIVAGCLGIILQLHEYVIITAGWLFLAVGVILAEPDPAKIKKPQPRPTAVPKYARATDDLIYDFLTKPENAAFKDQVIASTEKSIVARILIKKMQAQAPNNQLYAQMRYGRDFHDDLLAAVGHIKREERERPAPPPPKEDAPVPVFDVVLTDAGPSRNQTILAVRDVTQLLVQNARDLLASGVPVTILTGVSQDHAELAQDVLQEVGATVELRAAETPD
ncbi:MAG: ribosomal protein L7/L12 [Anaerolineae bacterium]|nr:ribosomal protein L7/L12 [Anaerolineae bacterium]